MSDKALVLHVWNREIADTPGGLSSLSQFVEENKSVMHLFTFTKEPMLYFYKDSGYVDDILEFCDTTTWNTNFGSCKCTSLPSNTVQKPEDYLIEGLKEKGIEVIKHIRS